LSESGRNPDKQGIEQNACKESETAKRQRERKGKSRMIRQKADIACDSVGSTLTVHIRGEIDHHTAADIRGEIDSILFERRPGRLVLNVSSVTFMDSSGLGLIMGRFSIMKELGGEMVVRDPSPEVKSILTLAGMERLLRVEYSDGPIPSRPPVTQKGRSGGQASRTPGRRATGGRPQGGGRSGRRPPLRPLKKTEPSA
jgi:stage II sporulation protein AA (anti-sigma F factor antagonist)